MSNSTNTISKIQSDADEQHTKAVGFHQGLLDLSIVGEGTILHEMLVTLYNRRVCSKLEIDEFLQRNGLCKI